MQTSDPSMDQTARISLHSLIMSKSIPKDTNLARANSVSANARHTSRIKNQPPRQPANHPQSNCPAAVKRYLGNQQKLRKRESDQTCRKSRFVAKLGYSGVGLVHLLRASGRRRSFLTGGILLKPPPARIAPPSARKATRVRAAAPTQGAIRAQRHRSG
jgi:hypothetical protein